MGLLMLNSTYAKTHIYMQLASYQIFAQPLKIAF